MSLPAFVSQWPTHFLHAVFVWELSWMVGAWLPKWEQGSQTKCRYCATCSTSSWCFKASKLTKTKGINVVLWKQTNYCLWTAIFYAVVEQLGQNFSEPGAYQQQECLMCVGRILRRSVACLWVQCVVYRCACMWLRLMCAYTLKGANF